MGNDRSPETQHAQKVKYGLALVSSQEQNK